ncbi:MAG: electron transfer flavoprotein subunit alpha/FixB family protein [Acidimicrobiaceae bacterium]|nr:electron transfer flavoprotein subunit alpha/FixB family protein [Acidimicrobiaceae bacterium]
MTAVLALIPVRDATLPAGALEAAAECGDRSLLIGERVGEALGHLVGEVHCCEAGRFRPGAWAEVLAHALADEPVVVLPASPDGRDLGPRLAAALDRPFFAGAVQVSTTTVVVPRDGGRSMHTMAAPASFVATLQVGVRGVEPSDAVPTVTPAAFSVTDADVEPGGAGAGCPDARVVAVLAPDAATVDLAEAGRIVGGGAGLHDAAQFDQLAALGARLGASVGATRVITDRGWIGHERQIGTTGVVVDPDLYLAFGISGAVQHTSGLGHPDHVVSVNTDAHCPMMQLADLAVVADANEVLTELLALLETGDG